MLCGWCNIATSWLVTNVWTPVWNWITRTWRTCTAAPCVWWCLCCNKWLCWIAMIVIAILSAVLFVVLVLITLVICVLCYILCLIGCLLPELFGHRECMPGCTGSGTGGAGGSGTGTGSSGLGGGTGTGTGTGLGTTTGTGTGTGTTTGVASSDDKPLLMVAARPCGCREGKIGVIVAVLLFSVLVAAGALAGVATSAGGLAGLGVAFAFGGAVVGKTIGLLRAAHVMY